MFGLRNMNGAVSYLLVIALNSIFVCESFAESARAVHSETAKKDQQITTIELSDGSRYQGDLKYGSIREGSGRNHWPDGRQYQGKWMHDRPHGRGIMLAANKDEYQGLFAFGQYDGLGDLQTAAGERYLGTFRFNKLDGLGIYISANDEYFMGEFSQHKRHGRFLFFAQLGGKPEYQIWFNDVLEKVIDIDDDQAISDPDEQLLIKQILASFTATGNKRLAQRKSNTHYQVRGRVRKIVSDVDESPEHAYGDLIINLLDLVNQ